MEETFSLILCICDQAYVRSNRRGTDWSCPACGSDDVDNLLEVPGPARDKVGGTEFIRLTQGGSETLRLRK